MHCDGLSSLCFLLWYVVIMAAGKEKGDDFYGVLGLKKECSATELRDAYKKLALRWHPDRCSASGNLKFVEEAKKKFQSIQEAYSVLSDANKRFLYDIGVYDSDDDENAMGDFLGEMTEMMSQSKPNEGRSESFEELQELFEEMFHEDCCGPASSSSSSSSSAFPPVKDPSTLKYSSINSSTSNFPKLSKRNCSDMCSGNANWSNMYDMPARRTFTLREEDGEDATTARTGRRPSRRKQKMSSSHDVSPHEARIST